MTSINPSALASNNPTFFTYENSSLTLTQNITYSDVFNSNEYITLASTDTFDGQGHTIDLSGVTGFQGLFDCSGGSTEERATIQNLGVLNGTLAWYAGYIVRQYQSYFDVSNCYSTGTIESYAGGIAGYQAGHTGECTITNCYSTGTIKSYAGGIAGNQAGESGECTITKCHSSGEIGHQAGGIAGQGAAWYNGKCTITKCHSSGEIKNSAGGIAGSIASGNNGTSIIENCYSSGTIGKNAGGIVGTMAGINGECTITNSYSTGEIGDNAGGIAGNKAGHSGECTITNCYSTGAIGNQAGGITGQGAGNNGECTITNCYSTGEINTNAGGIAGQGAGDDDGKSTITNCYSQQRSGNITNGTSNGNDPMDGNYLVNGIEGNVTAELLSNEFIDIGTSYPVLKGKNNYAMLQIIKNENDKVENLNPYINAVVLDNSNNVIDGYLGQFSIGIKQLFVVTKTNKRTGKEVPKKMVNVEKDKNAKEKYMVYLAGGEVEDTDKGIYINLENEGESVTLYGRSLNKTRKGYSKDGAILVKEEDGYYVINGEKWWTGSPSTSHERALVMKCIKKEGGKKINQMNVLMNYSTPFNVYELE